MHKPSSSLGYEDGITEWEFKNYLHFTWDGNTFHTDDPVSFLNADGEEMDIVDFCHSFDGDYFFIESEYARNANGIRVIPSAKYLYLYKESIKDPYAVLDLSNKNNIGAMEFSPDGKYLTFRQSGSIIYITETDTETSLTPRILFDSKDMWISDYKFSPDSSKMILNLDHANAVLLDISSGEKLELSLSSVDYQDENDEATELTEVNFLDNNTVIIGTSSGSLLVWDLRQNSTTTYSVSDKGIWHLTPINETSFLFSVEDSLYLYDIAVNQLTKVFYFK
jgi:WD40 repeat protein